MLQLAEFAVSSFWIYCTLSVLIMVTLVTTLASCLCCRKQEIKNDLLGLEGMVKLTNPEDTLTSQGTTVGGDSGGPGMLSGTDQTDRTEPESISKRASNAPHRSLPDIPVVEPVGDNNSELYATVGDKVQDLPQGRSPTSSLKKQASVSQHSSISQADDISSPYARVRSPPHAYDKLRRAEHPYAQVVQPGTSGTAQVAVSVDDDELLSPISRRGLSSVAGTGGTGGDSSQSLLDEREASTVDIPAASAIAGRVSASQDLPYMTPPIVQPPQQHFSGDSQDSSKGYTSISVREPLANLLPQSQNQTTAQRRQILGDSHYATVSDDSDEMYAAIDDPNNQGDLYTSGSETYAQIQPPNMVTVSVEINTGASSRPSAGIPQEDSLDALQPLPANSSTSAMANALHNRLSSNSGTMDESSGQPPPPPIDSLRAHPPHPSYAHSRQASSSSCTSSVGNLGSPKPEKRQANSPLPPTPKNLKHQSTNSFFSNSNLTSISSSTSTQTGQSGRNSVASVIEYKTSRENISAGAKGDDGTLQQQANGSAIKPKKSPSKDLEGMYAKVMKKNKLSKAPSQNSSPVPLRKDGTILLADAEQFLSDPELTQLNGSGSLHGSPSKKPLPVINSGNDYETLDKKQMRQHSHHQQDPGYETIPGDSAKNELRKSADYAQIQKRSSTAQGIQSVSRNSLEIFHGVGAGLAMNNPADGEPGYESLPGSSNDPGYETLNRKGGESDSDPNYEILRPAARNNDGYSSIRDKRPSAKNRLDFDKDDDTDSTPGYSSIKERIDYDPGYSVITEKKKPPVMHDYASITEETKRKKQALNNNNNLDPGEESDIYSSITNAPTITSNNNYSTIPEPPPNQTSSPGYSSISETRTTPSTDSTSSPDNLIGYTKQHNNNSATNNSNSRLSSNYESLTGSESDPNYESVKYLNVKENPYERLHNEPPSSSAGQTPSTAGPSSNDSLSKLTDTSTSSSVTPGAGRHHETASTVTGAAEDTTGSETPPAASGGGTAAKTPSVCELEATGVSDYFQV